MRSCLICDDHALVRDALALAVASRWPEARILEGASFDAAWALAAEGPELCLVDLAMPGAAPREGVARLRELLPEVPMLVVTGLQDDALLMGLLADGVAGFIPKTSTSSMILAAIELVWAGGKYYPPRVAELAAGAAPSPAPSPAAVEQGPALTPRQREVLELLADGKSNKEIGRDLELAPATVKTHVSQLITAFRAVNRTDVAVKAKLLGRR